jgi:hypothetical protein
MERFCRGHGFPLAEGCGGDTSTGIPGILRTMNLRF